LKYLAPDSGVVGEKKRVLDTERLLRRRGKSFVHPLRRQSAFQLVEPGSAPEIEQAIYFHAQHLQLMLDAWAARSLP